MLLTERGLGGDSVDLDIRRDNLRRDRSPRASSARQMAERFAAQVARSEPPPQDAEPMENGVLLALAYPDRVARGRGNGSFTLVNGRGASVEAASSLAREPFLAVAEIAGTAAAGRILLAAPLKLADIEHHFADRIEVTDDLTFDATSRSLRARAAAASGPWFWPSSRCPLRHRRRRPSCWRKVSAMPVSIACRGRKR